MKTKEKLTEEDLKTIYLILKAIDENQISYFGEEWEEDYDGEKLIDKKKTKRILEKLKKIIEENNLKEIDRQVLLRKYHTFSNEIDENIYSKLIKAFDNKKRIEIEYFSMERGEGIKRKIEIYYLSRKYMIAYCYLRNSIRKFRTSRIMDIKILDEAYFIPEDFNKNNYL